MFCLSDKYSWTKVVLSYSIKYFYVSTFDQIYRKTIDIYSIK